MFLKNRTVFVLLINIISTLFLTSKIVQTFFTVLYRFTLSLIPNENKCYLALSSKQITMTFFTYLSFIPHLSPINRVGFLRQLFFCFSAQVAVRSCGQGSRLRSFYTLSETGSVGEVWKFQFVSHGYCVFYKKIIADRLQIKVTITFH